MYLPLLVCSRSLIYIWVPLVPSTTKTYELWVQKYQICRKDILSCPQTHKHRFNSLSLSLSLLTPTTADLRSRWMAETTTRTTSIGARDGKICRSSGSDGHYRPNNSGQAVDVGQWITRGWEASPGRRRWICRRILHNDVARYVPRIILLVWPCRHASLTTSDVILDMDVDIISSLYNEFSCPYMYDQLAFLKHWIPD